MKQDSMNRCAGVAFAAALAALAVSACGGDDDRRVGVSEAPATQAQGSTAPTGSGAIDPSSLVSPVSNAPVGEQKVQETRNPAGNDPNPPRH
ncbi:hypothetical protein [Cupriavidus gilardii]|uniref:Lipoprotein n=1 Tax=Cupriavidus gilardii TaxID=82541 RepID=A0A849B709_9BURK|nr:hypothetical protein [Cupriavidus gilardii]KAB0595597.1 hypothetical protein F7Q96_17140 [Cupriavidus gilardii]MCT9013494.1 hypothetical protein [Cupriavidus gilardii]MCT9016423.1 hypothetical protein [Cupriavidus gilardii]MCT9056193.1 hypothetical protein [Cupriavidus gilardii]MCT9124148.1 hypothetical protein [Cupriavidus gilardii]